MEETLLRAGQETISAPAEAHPGEQRVRVRAEHEHDPLDLGYRGLGGDRLLEQRPPPEVGERLLAPTALPTPPRVACIQAAAS
jgi:hypothetical protein